MRLLPLINEYVRQKQALGMRFETNAQSLASFCRTLGPQLHQVMKSYFQWRNRHGYSRTATAPFFVI